MVEFSGSGCLLVGTSLLRILNLPCTRPLLCLSTAPEKARWGRKLSHPSGDKTGWHLFLCDKCYTGQWDGLQEVRRSAFHCSPWGSSPSSGPLFPAPLLGPLLPDSLLSLSAPCSQTPCSLPSPSALPSTPSSPNHCLPRTPAARLWCHTKRRLKSTAPRLRPLTVNYNPIG